MAIPPTNGEKVRLRVFGGLSIEANGEPLPVLANHRKVLALLALLAESGDRGLSRDKIFALLWPESDADRARNALSQLIFRVRRELGATAIQGNGHLKLNADVVTSDLAGFECALANGELERACTLYAGPFLDGIYLRDAPEFERWTDEQRHRLQVTVFGALEQLAASSTASGDHVAAAEWWRRRAAAEPLSARVALAYMESLLAAGDREAAIRFAAAHAAVVRTELEMDVDPEIARCVERARSESIPHSALPARPSPVPRHSPAVVEPVMRGSSPSRRRVMAALPVVLAVTLMVVVVTRWTRHAGATPVVLVAPFENSAGDSTLKSIGRVAASLVTSGIARSGVVSSVDAQTVAGTQPLGVRELVTRTGAGLVVTTSYYRRNDSLEFVARVSHALSGRVLAALPPVRALASDPSDGLAMLSSRIEGTVASIVDPRMASLVAGGSPPAPRFDAYKEYVEGLDYFMGRAKRTTDYNLAVKHFARAAELDSTFNLPYIWMAFAYGNLGFSFDFGNFGGWSTGKQDSVVDILASRRDALSPLDRHGLAFFLAQRRGLHESAYRAAIAASELAPGSVWTYVRAQWARGLGHHDDAVAQFRQLDVEHGWITGWSVYWRDFAAALHSAGRYQEQLELARRAATRSADPFSLRALAEVLGSMGDASAIDRFADSLDAAVPRPLPAPVPGAWLQLAAAEARVHNHLTASVQIANRCIRWHHEHVPDKAAESQYNLYLIKLSDCLYMAERWDEATAVSEDASSRRAIGPAAIATLALIAARTGDRPPSQGAWPTCIPCRVLLLTRRVVFSSTRVLRQSAATSGEWPPTCAASMGVLPVICAQRLHQAC